MRLSLKEDEIKEQARVLLTLCTIDYESEDARLQDKVKLKAQPLSSQAYIQLEPSPYSSKANTISPGILLGLVPPSCLF